jgi:glycosyltransferase involved in cell wall biosynthesis
MPAPLRIAHFIHRYRPALGGSEAYFARLSRHLAWRGHRVTVFTTTALDLEAFRGPGRVLQPGIRVEDGVEVRRFPLLRLPAQRWLLKLASLFPVRGWWQALMLPWNPLVPAMWRAANGDERFDVVHATAFPYGWPLACARRLAQRLGVPLLLTPFWHTGDADDPRDRTRRTFSQPALVGLARSADRLLVQTEGELQAFKSLGVPPGRLVLQGLGVDPAECTGGDRAKARSAWGFGADTPVVGHLANLSLDKGSLDLQTAAATAWEQGARFGLVLAGPQTAEFRRYCGTRGAGVWWQYPDSVRLLGELSDGQKRDFFAGIDVFALPSRIDSFGLVLLEAWANGLPNVGYRAGGVAWLIRDEIDGLLARCGDIDGLAAALCRLTGDADLRSRLGAEGRRRTRTEFRWEDKLRVVEQTLESCSQNTHSGSIGACPGLLS